jgi:hypothetical protein
VSYLRRRRAAEARAATVPADDSKWAGKDWVGSFLRIRRPAARPADEIAVAEPQQALGTVPSQVLETLPPQAVETLVTPRALRRRSRTRRGAAPAERMPDQDPQ